MKAWEIAGNLFRGARPVILSEEDQSWKSLREVSRFYDRLLGLDWASSVPGSGAPEKIMVAAVQALENRGYRVSDRGYALLREGLAAHEKGDFIALHKISAQLRYELNHAEKDPDSPYWRYRIYDSFEAYAGAVTFPEAAAVDPAGEIFRDQIRAGWLSQLVGAAMGTMVEGYTSENLYRAFGDVYDYLREPNTFNDDITFEVAFLDAFREKGYGVTSRDIALSWVGLIPSGWSAEEIALRNIKAGILPPESALTGNPFNEWIGAQMRAAICGMAAPGDCALAARLAWTDGEVSHAANGILGEVFNAVMIALAFVEKDVKKLLRSAIDMIPPDSEYRSVVDFAWNCCGKYSDWHDALAACSRRYERYNWIHAYPNACCEVIALYYGGGDFAETLHIVTMCGIDADCNAGMIMPVLGIQQGTGSIPRKLLHPAFSELTTYMRGYERITLEELVDATVTSIQKARTNQTM